MRKPFTLLLLVFCVYSYSASPTRSNVAYGNHSDQVFDYYRSISGKAPVAILVHGGGWMGGDKAAMTFFANMFYGQGYAVINMNYRLADTSISSTYTGFPEQVIDVAKVVKWAKDNPDSLNADPANIAIVGSSAGAHIASTYGLKQGDKQLLDSLYVYHPKHKLMIVGLAGVYGYDWVYSNRTLSLIKNMVRDSTQYWWSSQPVANRTGKAKPGFLIFHSINDDTAGGLQGRNMHYKLLDKGYCGKYYETSPMGHNWYDSLDDTLTILNYLDSVWNDQVCPPPSFYKGAVIDHGDFLSVGGRFVHPTISEGTFYVNQLDDNSSIKVFDLSGRVVLESKIVNLGNSFSLQSKGYYLVKITHELNTYSQKIIVR